MVDVLSSCLCGQKPPKRSSEIGCPSPASTVNISLSINIVATNFFLKEKRDPRKGAKRGGEELVLKAGKIQLHCLICIV